MRERGRKKIERVGKKRDRKKTWKNERKKETVVMACRFSPIAPCLPLLDLLYTSGRLIHLEEGERNVTHMKHSLNIRSAMKACIAQREANENYKLIRIQSLTSP